MNVVILAAGMGKRMQSDLPKVLHLLAGKPLLSHVIDTARSLKPAACCVVYGHGGDAVPTRLAADDLQFVLQQPQLGTGHAVMQAIPHLQDDQPTLVLYGDVPLTDAGTLQTLIRQAGKEKLAVLTVELDDPTGYGRIVREAGRIVRIVEQKDASDTERTIREVNTGILVAPTRELKSWLTKLSNNNAQGEYYLTDIIAQAVSEGIPVESAQPAFVWETLGVNSKVQLAELERIHQRNVAHQLLEQGVTLADPARIDVRGELICGRDVSIDVGCVFEGRVELGAGVRIGAHCVIANARIAEGAVIQPFTHIDGEKLGVEVGAGAIIGPFARLRPGAQLGAQVHIGNFVEVKNSTMAAGAKANHLAYLGDATVGERVNYGAGSITANYDGANKHRTVIEADVHIGSNCVLVAPVTIGAGGTVGGGSTITKSTEPGALSVARGKQISIANWARPAKKPKNG
jgi:bifunctional UDP-N-acetylglucosamine pyrophosphorylase/glucosamine-1-phosphate N-acetyltransferase